MTRELNKKEIERIKYFLDQGVFVSYPAERLHRRFLRVLEKSDINTLLDHLDASLERTIELYRNPVFDLATERQRRLFDEDAKNLKIHATDVIHACQNGFVEASMTGLRDLEHLQGVLGLMMNQYFREEIGQDVTETKTSHLSRARHKDLMEQQKTAYNVHSVHSLDDMLSYVGQAQQILTTSLEVIQKTITSSVFHMDEVVQQQNRIRLFKKISPPSFRPSVESASQNMVAKPMLENYMKTLRRAWKSIKSEAPANHDIRESDPYKNTSENNFASMMLAKLIRRRQEDKMEEDKLRAKNQI